MAIRRRPRQTDDCVKDADCVGFLQWALPRLQMRWPGFRRVRKQVCKRIQRRLAELSCADVEQYRTYLHAHPQEWPVLDALCRVTVTRFYRDRQVFAVLIQELLPELARAALRRGEVSLRLWCAGCASGEEPYTFAIAWHRVLSAEFPNLAIDILATDADAALLARAARACYAWSAVRNLPADWRASALDTHEDCFCLKPTFKAGVRLVQQDVRRAMPEQRFDLICCRNLAFTYFDTTLQVRVAEALHEHLLPGGVLALGVRETLPEGAPRLQVLSRRLALFRKAPPIAEGGDT